MKKLLIVWIFIAVLAVGGLTVLGLMIVKKEKPYRDFEKELVVQAKRLGGEKPSILNTNSKITLSDFLENGYTINTMVNGSSCTGYVEIKRSRQFFDYKAYIKCPNYTTKGYENS